MEGRRCVRGGLVALVFVATLLASASTLTPASPPRPAVYPVRTLATSVTLGYSGLSPREIYLNWTPTSDVCFSFYSLQISQAGVSGPYSEVWNFSGAGATSAFVEDVFLPQGLYLSPGLPNWWRVIDGDCAGAKASSNILEVVQPAVATATYDFTSVTSVAVHWTNGASYGGGVGFGHYRVFEQIGAGNFVGGPNMTAVGERNATFSGLTPSTTYSFYVETTDICGVCGSGTNTTTNSNTMHAAVPGPLTAQASVSGSAVAGSPVTLVCTASGGTAPYSYSWNFGDGTMGSGATTTHTYAQPGTMTATCTVTDASSSTTTKSVTVAVGSATSSTSPAPQPAVGLNPLTAGIIVGSVVVLLVAAIVLLMRRERPPAP